MSRFVKVLPARPSFQQLQKQAKQLLKMHRAGDADSIQRFQSVGSAAATLADAQFVLAREYGFESWARLKHHLAALDSTNHVVMSSSPPFYRIDWKTNTIEPQQQLSASDWDRVIEVMKEMHLTGLNGRGQITDAVIARIAALEHVRVLNFDGTKGVTDAGLQHLARMHQLEQLDLSDYPGGVITDSGLEALRHLPELRRFQMCWQCGVTDDGVANLAFCEKIERVDLLGSPTGDGAIRALAGKGSLRHFKTGKFVSDAGLPLLHDLPVFKTWQEGKPAYDLMTFGNAQPNFLMLDGSFSDAGLNTVAGLNGIFGLGFYRHLSRMTPNGLRPLVQLPNLGALGCQGALCDDTAMRHIASLPRLRMLMAQGTVASDAGFEALSQAQTLEYLWGRECPNLSGRGFVALRNIPALKGLAVSCKYVDDASLAALPDFPSLAWLLPMDVSDQGFRHVGKCAKLEKLTCMYCRDTTDTATEYIASLDRLREYYAGQTLITDRSLEILGGMTSLEVIELSACAGISDAGLAYIAKLPRLKTVSVDATPRVTRGGIAVFPPGVRVDFWT